jgi:acetyl esterase/lipase
MGAAGPTRTFVYGDDDPRRQVVHALEGQSHHAPRPAVMLLHGGGLTGGTPLQDMDWAEPLADRGFVVFMAGYRLFEPTSGDDPWPTQIADARRAMRWIRAHAGELSVDPHRIGAMGHSSGGHLAGLLGTTDPPDDADPELAGISSRATCVVTLAGDADLLVPYRDRSTTGVFEALLGGTVEERRDVWREASPVYHVDEATVPFLVIHGNRDEAVPIRMARNLAAALAAAGVEHVLAELPAGHMDVGMHPTASALWTTFLAAQLRP